MLPARCLACFLASPALIFFFPLQSIFGTHRQAFPCLPHALSPTLVISKCASAPSLFLPAPAVLAGVPSSFLPLQAKQTADLITKNCKIKFPRQFGLGGETFPFSTPIPEEGGLQLDSPANVRLSWPSEMLLALGPVDSNEVCRSMQPVQVACSLELSARPPTQAAAASSARHRLVPSVSPAVQKRVFLHRLAASAASEPNCSPHSLLPSSH